MKRFCAIFSFILIMLLCSSCSFSNLIYESGKTNNGKTDNGIYKTSFDSVSRTEKEILTGTEIYKKVSPSMVSVINLNANGNQNSEGSGFIISEEGLIVTNAHVVEGADSLSVILNDENETPYSTELFWYDTYTDIAVIKIDALGLTPIEFGISNEMEIGEEVYALGNPGGYEFRYSLTKGIISKTKIEYAPIQGSLTIKCFLVDAAINPGNSGGALINSYGQIIAINSAKIVSDGFENMGFAIYIDEALPIIEELITDKAVSGRPALGITYTPATNVFGRMVGIKIESVKTESDLYGKIAVGDVIYTIDTYDLTATEQITKALSGKKPNDEITIKYGKKSENYKIEHELSAKLIDAKVLNQD